MACIRMARVNEPFRYAKLVTPSQIQPRRFEFLNGLGVLRITDVPLFAGVMGRIEQQGRGGQSHQVPFGKVVLPGRLGMAVEQDGQIFVHRNEPGQGFRVDELSGTVLGECVAQCPVGVTGFDQHLRPV